MYTSNGELLNNYCCWWVQSFTFTCFFAGDTQEVPAVSSSYDSHASEEVSSQQNGHPKYLPGLYLFDFRKLPSASYFINSLVSSTSVVFLYLNVFPLGWCHVWGWTSERLLHVNGYRLYLHLEKSKKSWGFFYPWECCWDNLYQQMYLSVNVWAVGKIIFLSSWPI